MSLSPSVLPAALLGHPLALQVQFEIEARQWSYRLQQGLKRLADIVLALLGLVALAPLLGSIALLVCATSPGPVFYRSTRIGRNQQPFGMLKFRTMVADADAQREVLRRQAKLEGQLFKLSDDPRVTGFGRLLRATSLDELPQLINVLRGDMSLVGPRPLPPDESVLFRAPYTVRFSVLPGITGIWQVSGRSNVGFERLCELELNYLTGWNLLRDIDIMARTVPAVCLRQGAY